MQLVPTMPGQIDAKLEIDNGKRACFTVEAA